MINFDYSSLLSLYESKAGLGATGGTAAGRKAPLAPWSPGQNLPPAPARVKAALSNQPILDVAGARRKLPKSEEDFAELFALYNAMDTLKALAERRDAKGLGALERTQIERKFNAGMAEVTTFIDGIDLDKLQLVRGAVTEAAKTGVGVKRDRPEYKTGIVHQGGWEMPVDSLQGDVRFSMKVVVGVTTRNVDFDLAEMGATARTLGEVTKYMNGKLEAAGVSTRFEREKIPGEKRTLKVGTRIVNLPDGPEQWSLKIKGLSTEALSFSAPAAADAVYLAQTVGKVGAQTGQLAKFQTDRAPDSTPTTAPPAYHNSGEPNWVEGKVFTKALDGDIAAVRASATHTDGSVYMLAEVTGMVADQTIKAERDVALLKYDAAGNLVFSRTLGAASQADASALAIAADGTVAIGGAVRGELMGATTTDRKNLDSFVTVFNGEGEELWTKRGGAATDDQVRALTFGADGTLYASGQVTGSLLTENANGGTDAWLRAYKTTTTLQADNTFKTDGELQFTTQYGTAGEDTSSTLAVDGNVLVVGGIENGHGVLRRFDLQATGDPTAGAVRDLGHLLGGKLAGMSIVEGRVVLVGGTSNPGLSATSTTGAYSGSHDAFVANLALDLNDGTDTLGYWGGVGQEQLTGVAFKGRDVYVSGTSTDAIGADAKIAAKDGFLARLNWQTGAAEWSRRFTGKEGEIATGPIAVAAGGASVLDRLGLPTGAIDFSGSQLVTAATSARAGDRFFVKAGPGARPVAVTLEAQDTLKTLSAKITRALGFNGTAEVIKDFKTGATAGDTSEAALGLFERIQIKAKSDRTPIEIQGGESSRNLLEALGLEEGVVRTLKRDRKGVEVPLREGKTYGLKLARDLAIDTKEGVKRTSEELGDALTAVQLIYRDLSNAMKPKSAAITGPVPAYLRNQISNYAAGLARLTGGG